MKNSKTLGLALLSVLAVSTTTVSTSVIAESGKITSSLTSVTVKHNGKEVEIKRTVDSDAVVPKTYAKTGRACPPFCIQPMHIVPGVETVGELEVLGFLKRISSGDRKIMVVDSRSPEWMGRGTIPGSTNIPWSKINHDVEGTFAIEAEAETLNDVLINQFGAQMVNGQWDFRNAKTLVMFCNGNWCPQSAMNIKTLTKLGYPAYKLKWYRGGMQSWVSLGLTTTKS